MLGQDARQPVKKLKDPAKTTIMIIYENFHHICQFIFHSIVCIEENFVK